MTDGPKPDMPNGWQVASLCMVTEVNPKLDKFSGNDNPTVSFVPMPAVGAGTGTIDVSRTRSLQDVKKGYTHFREGDVLFAKITPCMENGKMAIVPPLKCGLGFGSTEFHVLRPNRKISAQYIYWFVSSEQFRRDAQHNMTGAVGQRRVPAPYLAHQAIPVPPAREQHRIAAKIEELFSELDKGVESLKTARAQLSVYRQAVLKHAFEGTLTAQWREENKDKLETSEQLLARIKREREARYERQLKEWKAAVKTWEAKGKPGRKPRKPRDNNRTATFSKHLATECNELPLGWAWATIVSIFDVVSGGTPKGLDQAKGNDIPFYKVSDMNTPGNETWMHTAAIYLSEPKKNELGLTTYPENTVIFPKRGGAILTNKKRILSRPSCFDLNTMGVVNSISSISSDYLWRWFSSLNLAEIYDGSNVPQINNRNVEPLPFPICSIEEQREISNILGKTLSLLDETEANINQELQKAAALRQLVLKRAFAGQLVAQNPSDEPALALLGRIKAEREQTSKRGKATKGTRKKRTAA